MACMTDTASATKIGRQAAKKTRTSAGQPTIGGVLLTRAAGIAAIWGTQRILTAAFKKRAGHEPPSAADTKTSIGGVIGWAVVSAASLATVQVLVDRWAARRALAHLTAPSTDVTADV
jgi:cytochrome c oxidase assembly factor CtaG